MVANFLVIMVGMLHSFSPDRAANPSEVASVIAFAMLPLFAVIPLGVLGIVLLILGFVIRRPVDKREDKV